MSQRIHAEYWIETAHPLKAAAETMAGEQSSGTFVKLPGETPELKERHGARVEQIDELDSVGEPSLPGASVPKDSSPRTFRRARVELSWPLDNLGPSLPNLLATVAGNLFELKQFSGLRLLDVRLPKALRNVLEGPRFGVAETRRLAGVDKLALIGTIIKPSVGLSPEATVELASLAEAGLDFIKDDKLQADGPHRPFADRVRHVMRALNGYADRTGRKVMHAFNLTGEIDQMRRRHDIVHAAGGTCVMASIHSIGLPGMVELRRHSQLPIHAHRNGWGLYSRSPHIGVSYIAWQKLWRLAGADHIHVNELRNKFCEPDDSVVASARQCLAPMFDGQGRGCEAMPVFSSGQWAENAFDTYAALGSADLIHATGGGIMAHPGGIAAGVMAMRQAWEGALAGRSAEEVAAGPRGIPPGPGEVRFLMRDLPLTYYGDDFTGSTDVMEVLTWAGLPAVLFIELPDAARLASPYRICGRRNSAPSALDVGPRFYYWGRLWGSAPILLAHASHSRASWRGSAGVSDRMTALALDNLFLVD